MEHKRVMIFLVRNISTYSVPGIMNMSYVVCHTKRGIDMKKHIVYTVIFTIKYANCTHN
jgi:hypothetical protein